MPDKTCLVPINNACLEIGLEANDSVGKYDRVTNPL